MDKKARSMEMIHTALAPGISKHIRLKLVDSTGRKKITKSKWHVQHGNTARSSELCLKVKI